MLCALIMAGGKGTRFWPLSTEENPKQFLNLVGNESMIQKTVSRLTDVIPMERIFVVTDSKYEQLIVEHLPHIPTENIIIEPLGMNTAPCIALSAMLIERKFPNTTLAVLPSDHLVENEVLFRETLVAADCYIKSHPTSVVTLGMNVTRPEVGYGYIKYANQQEEINNISFFNVERFVEKPDYETAMQYMDKGCYLWNGGMFIWNTRNIINLTQEYLPQTYTILKEIVSTSEEEFTKVLYDLYPKVENISVDYGIMEKVNQITVIPSDFGWDDIGSWLSLERYKEKDSYNNVMDGEISLVNSRDNIIVSKTKPVVMSGIENVILVETDDVIMLVNKDEVGSVSKLRSMNMRVTIGG